MCKYMLSDDYGVTPNQYHRIVGGWADEHHRQGSSRSKCHRRGQHRRYASTPTGRTGFFVQFALPGVIEINCDVATTRCLCHEAARGPSERYYRKHCVAFDLLRRSKASWVFTGRSFQYLWLDTSPYSGNGFALFPNSVTEPPP
jgi:hypothetical protein